MNKFPIVVNQDNSRVEFGKAGGGFPTRVVLKEGNGSETVIIENDRPQLIITLGDGRQLSPFVPDDCVISCYPIAGGAERLEFRKLLWADTSGAVMDKFQMSLRHEFWPDGTTFANAFFMVECNISRKRIKIKNNSCLLKMKACETIALLEQELKRK